MKHREVYKNKDQRKPKRNDGAVVAKRIRKNDSYQIVLIKSFSLISY